MVGTSHGTVDRVINNRGNVSSELEAKILSIIEENSYTPNPIASALVKNKKNLVIGVLLTSIGNEFFNDIKIGIEKAKSDLNGYGLNIIIKEQKGFNSEEQISLIDELIKENINILVITPIDTLQVCEKLNSLIRNNIQIICLNADIHGVDKLLFIGCNYKKSGVIAGNLMGLFEKQQTKIGIIIGSTNVFGHTARVDGFNKAIKQYKNLHIVDIIQNNDDDETSYSEVMKLLLTHRDINALYFTAGGVGGGINAVKKLGLNGRITIITFDEMDVVVKNILEGNICATITQQPIEQGYQAIQLAFDYIYYGMEPKQKVIYTSNEIRIKSSYDFQT